MKITFFSGDRIEDLCLVDGEVYAVVIKADAGRERRFIEQIGNATIALNWRDRLVRLILQLLPTTPAHARKIERRPGGEYVAELRGRRCR